MRVHDRLDLRTLDALALQQRRDQRGMRALVAVQRLERLGLGIVDDGLGTLFRLLACDGA